MRSLSSFLLLVGLAASAFAAAPADDPLPVYSMVSGTEQDHVLHAFQLAALDRHHAVSRTAADFGQL